MEKILTLGIATMLLLTFSCSNNDSEIEEMKAKLNKQEQELNEQKENMLKKDIAEKEEEIAQLKSKKSTSNPTFFARGKGMFPEGSERRLTNDDVYDLSPRELKIMRNEIFARHGFIFKTNDMRNHFSTQAWYRPLNENVTNMLSQIEQENVNFIRAYE